MNIGIDIDGVITDLEKFHVDYGTKFSFETGKGNLVNPGAYNSYEAFNWDVDTDNEFWITYMMEYNKPRNFTKEVIDKLREDGCKIYIITARSKEDGDLDIDGELLRKCTYEFLKQNDIKYDEIYFTKDKLEYCLEQKIDVMIEDKVENINEISQKIPVICFNTSYNKECTGKNITRCYSWYDIYKIIKERKN